MSAMLLVVELAGRRAALPADAIDSVIELERAVPVPGAPPHIAGLAALRSRPLTVVDCHAAMGLPAGCTPDACRAVVVDLEGHLYGLLVDNADDIVGARGDLMPLGADPGPGWDRACQGMIETEIGLLPLLDIAALLDGPAEAMVA